MRWAAVIALVTIGIYVPMARAPFVYEDRNWVGTMSGAQVFGVNDQWPGRYLTQWSYREQAIGGEAGARRYHLANVAWHLITGLFVWALGRQLGLSQRASVMAAAVFLWHPLNVAAVAYVSARSDLLMTLCAVLAVGLPVRRRWWAVLFVVPACVLSGAAKELGAVSVLLVLWTWHRRWWWWAVASAPLVGLIVTWKEYGVVWPAWAIWMDVASANVMSLWRVLGLMVVPVGMNLDPDPWFWAMPHRLVGVVALVGCAVWAWRSGVTARWALGWMAVVCVPRLVMPTYEPIHDQHAYLAMVAFALSVGAWWTKEELCVEY